jgi:hypothetical protein
MARLSAFSPAANVLECHKVHTKGPRDGEGEKLQLANYDPWGLAQ